jgi:hypothetical protein
MLEFRRIRHGSLLSLLVGSAVCVAASVAPSAAQDACLAQGQSAPQWSNVPSLWGSGEESASLSGKYDPHPRIREFSFPAAGTPNRSSTRRSGGGGVSYLLAPWLKADLKYKHAFVFESGPSGAIREKATSGFSVDGDRDILDFTMSWERALSSLNLGYRLESTRPGSGAVPEDTPPGWFPGSAAALHGLTVGVTRRWGGAP